MHLVVCRDHISRVASGPQVVHDPDQSLGDVCQLGAEVAVLGRDRRLHGSKRERE